MDSDFLPIFKLNTKWGKIAKNCNLKSCLYMRTNNLSYYNFNVFLSGSAELVNSIINARSYSIFKITGEPSIWAGRHKDTIVYSKM